MKSRTPAFTEKNPAQQVQQQKKQPQQCMPFADQRDSHTHQRKLIDMAANSPQVQQHKSQVEHINQSALATAQLKQQSLITNTLQRATTEEEEPTAHAEGVKQAKFNNGEPAQRAEEAKPNNTGLPDNLKSGVESLSGMSMDHVKVHYNSPQPAQLNALAYAQGSDIHVAPGQEQHLPHEAWHVVQQAQGRVKPTTQMKEGVPVNDDAGLEHEADVMGAKALANPVQAKQSLTSGSLINPGNPLQMRRYTTERSIKLDLGTKEWKKDDKTGQTAKTRARGQALAHLREIYPPSDSCPKSATPQEKDDTRGPEFLEARDRLDQKYKALDTDTGEETAESTRTAIYKNAPEGVRASKSQALGVIALTKRDDYIGAHLVKREWGGADNMWNVVAWLQAAENKWAAGFEKPVDMKGVFGEDPGPITIRVVKEDEIIGPDAHEAIVQDAPLTQTGMEAIATARATINRAVESVPLTAEGINYTSTTTLSGAETGYTLAERTAEQEFANKVTAATKISKERSDFGGKRPLPDSIDTANELEGAKALKERRTDWTKEKQTYEAGGDDAFEFTNNLFKENDD